MQEQRTAEQLQRRAAKDAGRTASSHQDPPAEEGRESCTGGDCEHLYSPSLIPRSPLQFLSLAFCNANDGEEGQKRLELQREEYESAVQRHQCFIDQVSGREEEEQVLC